MRRGGWGELYWRGCRGITLHSRGDCQVIIRNYRAAATERGVDGVVEWWLGRGAGGGRRKGVTLLKWLSSVAPAAERKTNSANLGAPLKWTRKWPFYLPMTPCKGRHPLRPFFPGPSIFPILLYRVAYFLRCPLEILAFLSPSAQPFLTRVCRLAGLFCDPAKRVFKFYRRL